MQNWDSIGPTTRVIRTYFLPPKLRDAGVTINSFTVTPSLYPNGVSDPNAVPTILDGAGALNTLPINYAGATWKAGQAILQGVTGVGTVIGASYIVAFAMALSNGDPNYVEECLQPVTQYVPA